MTFLARQFSTSSLRKLSRGDDICQILASTINSADVGVLLKQKIKLDGSLLITPETSYDLTIFKHIYMIAAGKAAVPMANTLQEILKDRITSGLVITKEGYLGPHQALPKNQINVLEASHPIPDHRNLEASLQVTSLFQHMQKDDLVICLFSGGASSLLMKPSSTFTLKNLQDTTALLLKCGASIDEINTIRKHLDDFKGGGLAKILFPATVITCLLSDVMGNSLNMIASGPTIADPTTYTDAWAILNKYQIMDQIPAQVRFHILTGMSGNIAETLKPGDPILEKIQNILIGNNEQTVLSAIHAAKSLGFYSSLLTTKLQGEASTVCKSIFNEAISLLTLPPYLKRPACFVAGGETTVTIRGTGNGGRNQELALGVVEDLSHHDRMVVITLATDGGDGPTDAAGAVVTNNTYSRGLEKRLIPADYLARNDSYHYFQQLDDLIKTGPTLTNVSDLIFVFGL